MSAAPLAVEVIEEPLLTYDAARRQVRNQRPDDTRPPLTLLLGRDRFWREDGHLEAVVQLGGTQTPEGQLTVAIRDAGGRALWQHVVAPIPGQALALYPELPEELADDTPATLEVLWQVAGSVRARQSAAFRVASAPPVTPPAGRVALQISNRAAVHAQAVPFTVGVPFPRGVLAETAHLRLTDAASGQEIPLQVKETARWSKHGSVKWVLCDFTLDLQGEGRSLHLNYGPQVRRVERDAIAIDASHGFPRIRAGHLQVREDGFWFERGGQAVRVLDSAVWHGAFVEHGDGTPFVMSPQDTFDLEEAGPEKVVIRRLGWYRQPEGERTFCQYITRYVFHRDSPLVRIFHTWIFTGDGNRETIANMGWRLPLAEGAAPGGFLTDAEAGTWQPGDYLLQYDYEHFDVVTGDARTLFPGGRAAGVARAEVPGAQFYFGTRDFWQSYPAELEFSDGALWFHNWPRHNRPAGYSFEGSLQMASGEPALPSAARHATYRAGELSRSQWKLNVLQARFAHEGEHLNFRLPEALGEDPIWSRSSRERTMSTYWEKGDVTSANAQGIARTEEMWLYVAGPDESAERAAAVLTGLNDQTLRAVVDPAWVAASGAFHEIHPQDRERFPDEERVYDLITRAPGQWIERLGLYGKWIYGDIAAWNPRLQRREPELYRAFRKRHQGWPYSWVPYARSGQSDLLRLADAATRRNIDANYCHYVSPEVAAQTEKTHPRRLGRWHRSTLPWASRKNPTSRCYESQTDFLWHAWYLTGYHRAKDNALDWAVQTKREEDLFSRGPIAISTSNRVSISVMHSYIDMYEATFDPWFLVGMHAIAQGHLHRAEGSSWTAHGAGDNVEGLSHFWRPAERDFLRFTGSETYLAYYLRYVNFWGRHWGSPSWTQFGAPMIEPNAYAWRLTGEAYYRRRVAKFPDWARVAIYDAEADENAYLQGHITSGQVALFTGWYLQYLPVALAVLAESSEVAAPIYDAFFLRSQGPEAPVVAIDKPAGEAITLSMAAAPLLTRLDRAATVPYRLTGPGGAVVEGTWPARDRHEVLLAADAPAGIYRLQVAGSDQVGLEVPAVKDGAREVIEVSPGAFLTSLPRGSREVQYWFMVPEEVRSFRVEIQGQRAEMRRLSIWGPEGQRVWDHQELPPDLQSRDVAAEVLVAPEQAGKLWRITLPGGGAFRLDAQIPPRYAVQPESWFAP